MKKNGCVCDFVPRRNAELYKTFRHTLVSTSSVDMNLIYKLTADAPSSRFWTSERRAAEVISMMLRGISISFMSPTRQEMFRELFRRFLELRSADPKESVSQTVVQAVNSPAPKFYLTPKSVKVILCRYRAQMRGAKDKKGGER